jgi:hypothetical protein
VEEGYALLSLLISFLGKEGCDTLGIDKEEERTATEKIRERERGASRRWRGAR